MSSRQASARKWLLQVVHASANDNEILRYLRRRSGRNNLLTSQSIVVTQKIISSSFDSIKYVLLVKMSFSFVQKREVCSTGFLT